VLIVISKIDGSPGAIRPSPAGQSSETVLNLKFTDLLGFLQQHGSSHASLQMTCPFSGVPLPSIYIDLESTLGLSGKLEFSIRLSEALVQYMRVSRSPAAEISH